jgi:hypothetical protein
MNAKEGEIELPAKPPAEVPPANGLTVRPPAGDEGGLTNANAVLDPAEFVRRLKGLHAIRKAVLDTLEKDVDYGTQPGVEKPFLWQSGASKICFGFNIIPEYDLRRVEIDRELPDGGSYKIYRGICVVKLVSRATGHVVFTGPERSASSTERKFSERMRARKRKNNQTGEWYEVAPEPLESLIDTIDAAAQKRALVHATRLMAAVDSDFTQDEELVDPAAEAATAAAPIQPVKVASPTVARSGAAPAKPAEPAPAQAPAPAAAPAAPPKPEFASGDQFNQLSKLCAVHTTTVTREMQARKWTNTRLTFIQAEQLIGELSSGGPKG